MSKSGSLLPGLVLLLPLGACSLFRQVAVSRQDSLYSGHLQQTLDWKADSMQSASRVLRYSDSSGAEFEAEIVPTGVFSFSAQGGFSGSASVVRLRGKAQREIRSADSSSRQLHVQSAGRLKQEQKMKAESSQTERTKKGSQGLWSLSAFLLVVLFVIAGILYSKKFLFLR